MTSEKALRLAMVACLALSMIMYHLLEVWVRHSRDIGLFDLAKIAQIAVTAIVFIGLIQQRWVARLFLGDGFIGGFYTGVSAHLNVQTSQQQRWDIEFTIDQTLFGATLSGHSTNADGLVSTWTGQLYRIEAREFSFALELKWKDPEYGVAKIIFREGNANGVYYTADPGYPYPFSISATQRSSGHQS